MSSYDQNLLDEAPRATRAQLQEGYNVDLLQQPPRRTPSARNPPPQTPLPAPDTLPLAPGIAENDSGEKFNSPAYPPSTPRPRASFWRSRNGIITIAVIVLVVIGAVVGGVVGGTVKKSSNNNIVPTTGSSSVTTSTSPTSSADQASTQAVGGGDTRPTGFGTSTTSERAIQTGVQNNIG